MLHLFPCTQELYTLHLSLIHISKADGEVLSSESTAAFVSIPVPTTGASVDVYKRQADAKSD